MPKPVEGKDAEHDAAKEDRFPVPGNDVMHARRGPCGKEKECAKKKAPPEEDRGSQYRIQENAGGRGDEGARKRTGIGNRFGRGRRSDAACGVGCRHGFYSSSSFSMISSGILTFEETV